MSKNSQTPSFYSLDDTRRTLFWQMLNIILTVLLFTFGCYLIRQGNRRLDASPEDDFKLAVSDW